MNGRRGVDTERYSFSSPDAAYPPPGEAVSTRTSSFDRLSKLAANLLDASATMLVRADATQPALLGVFGHNDADLDGARAKLPQLLESINAENTKPQPQSPQLQSTQFECSAELSASNTAYVIEQMPGPAFDGGTCEKGVVTVVPIGKSNGSVQMHLCLFSAAPCVLTAAHHERLADIVALIRDEIDRTTSTSKVEDTPQSPALDGDEFAPPQEQELIHSILNALFVFVGILQSDGTLIDANDPPLRAASLDITDVRGKPFWECYWWSFDKSEQDRLRDAVGRAAAGEGVRYDAEVRIADGRLITIDFCLSPLRDANGHVSHLIASGVDISRRHHAETELRRMARIVDDAPFLIRSATLDGRLLYLNRHGRELLGYAPDGGLTNAEVSHHHPDWAMRKLHDEGYPAARQDGSWMGDVAIIDSDGRELPMSHAIVAHRDTTGAVEYFSSIGIDISGEKATEAALKESELRFRGTFENAAVGMAHIALSGRWLRVNERLLDILGYGRAELVQTTLQDITHPDDIKSDLEMLQKLRDKLIESYSLQKRYFRKDHSLVWVETTVSMQATAGQSEPYFISIVEDITKRKEAEQRQRLLLSELNHRVKNTLAMIQSIANQTMRQSKDARTFVSRFTGRIHSLSGAHDLLTDQTWDGADLAELLSTQVSLNGTIDQSRIKLSGPSVLLPPQVALNLALVIHELSNNAVQYGAYASESGKVEVNWTISDGQSSGDTAVEKHLEIVWTESGGPPVELPRQRGFGAIILDRGLKLGLRGNYDLDWRSEGLVARLGIPLPVSGFRSELFRT